MAEKNICKKSVDKTKIRNIKFTKSKQNVELSSTSDSASSFYLSCTVPETSGRAHKIKAKVTHTQAQSDVHVGSDSHLPTLQSLKYDQQIQAQVDQRLRE